MKRILYLVLVGMFCMLTSCSESGVPDSLGKTLCACRSNLLVLNKELLESQKSGDEEQFIEILKKLENAAEESEDCTEAALEKAGVNSEKTYTEAMEMMKATCPELSDFFE